MTPIKVQHKNDKYKTDIGLHYLTNRLYFPVCVYCNRSQVKSVCKEQKVRHETKSSGVTLFLTKADCLTPSLFSVHVTYCTVVFSMVCCTLTLLYSCVFNGVLYTYPFVQLCFQWCVVHLPFCTVVFSMVCCTLTLLYSCVFNGVLYTYPFVQLISGLSFKKYGRY